MAEILHQLIGSVCHYLQGFLIIPGGCLGVFPSTVLVFGRVHQLHFPLIWTNEIHNISPTWEKSPENFWCSHFPNPKIRYQPWGTKGNLIRLMHHHFTHRIPWSRCQSLTRGFSRMTWDDWSFRSSLPYTNHRKKTEKPNMAIPWNNTMFL